MKEVVKVSIAGISFTLDKDAFDKMDEYLDKLESAYRNNTDGREIVADIEARIVEIILSGQSAEQVVELPLVESIIVQIGMPEGMEVENGAAAENIKDKFPKRLYRNLDGAKIGGVCNGLGAYFATDKVWFRLGLFLPLLLCIIAGALDWDEVAGFMGAMFGMFVLLYFILWIAIPAARTPRQKLEMQGERVTVSSIEKRIARDAAAMPGESNRAASVLGELMTIIGHILIFSVKAVVLLIGLSLAALVIFLIFGVIGGGVLEGGLAMRFADFEGISTCAFMSIVIAVVIIPLCMLIYAIFAFVLNARINRTIMWILLGLWIVAVGFTTAMAIKNSEQIKRNIKNERFWMSKEKTGRIYGDEDDPETKYRIMVDGSMVVVDGDTLTFKENRREIKKRIQETTRDVIFNGYEIDVENDTPGTATIEVER